MAKLRKKLTPFTSSPTEANAYIQIKCSLPAVSNVTTEPKAAVGGTALSAEQVVKRVCMWPSPSMILLFCP